MLRLLQILAFGLLLLLASGCGDAVNLAPTPVPGSGNTTASTVGATGGGTNPATTLAASVPSATSAPADTAGGPPIAVGQADDLIVNVYKVLPYDVPADAPPISQPKAGMQAVIVDLEVKSKKPSLLKANVSGSNLLAGGGALYKTNDGVLGYYMSVCGCKDDQAAYDKFVSGLFQPGEAARTYLAYTGPKGTQPAKLQLTYVKGEYKDETEAFLNGKETTLLVDLPH